MLERPAPTFRTQVSGTRWSWADHTWWENALAAGGIGTLTAILMMLRDLTDRPVVYVTVPVIALGIALILVCALGSKRTHDRHRVAMVPRKLGG